MQVIVTTLQVVLVLVVVAQTVAYVWDLDIACCRGVWLGVPVIVLSGMLIGGAWMHHKLHQDKLAMRQRLRLRPHASQMDDEKGANEQPLASHDPSPANASPRMLSPPPCSPRLPAQPPTPPMLITDDKVQPQKEPLPRQVATFRPESMFLPESLPHEPTGPSQTSMPVTKQPLLPPVPALGPRPLQKQAALPVSQPLPRQQQPKQQPQQSPPSPPSPPSHPVVKRSQEPVPAAQPAKKTRRHRRSRKKQQSLPTPVQPPSSASAPTPGPSTSASASIASSSSSNKPLGATLQGKTPKEQRFSARNVDFPNVSVPFSSASPLEKKESKKRHAQGGGSSKDRASFSQQLHTSSSSSSNQKFPPPPTSSRPPNSNNNNNNNNTSSSSTARSYYSPFRTGLQIDIPARDSALYTTPAAQLADYRLFPPQTTQPPHPVAYHSSANASQLASSTTVVPPEATFNPTIALAPQGATFNPIITLAPTIALSPHPVHAKHSSTTTTAAPRTRSASVSTTASSAHPSTTAFWPPAYPPSPPSPSSPVIAPPTSKSWYPWQASPPQPRPFSLFHQHPTPNEDEKH